MRKDFIQIERKTTADEVFRKLHSEIVSMRLKPGSKLSEVEVAKSFDVSRQPVREAFKRLADFKLLQIRPQKSTLVRKFSNSTLKSTRFIRTAIEIEVVRMACKVATEESLSDIAENLEQQKFCIAALDPLKLAQLDYEFHRLICVAANCQSEFKIIAENKTQTDRVCALELSDVNGMKDVLKGHTKIVRAITSRQEDAAVKSMREHLNHLDDVLISARESHSDYFED